jgi:hypothetical protein
MEFVEDKHLIRQTTQKLHTTQDSYSSTSILYALVSAGLTTPPLVVADGDVPWSLTLGGNIGHLGLTGGQGILHCLDCDSEYSGLEGGGFLEFDVGLRRGLPTGFGPSVRFRLFPWTSDLENSLTVEFTVRHTRSDQALDRFPKTSTPGL